VAQGVAILKYIIKTDQVEEKIVDIATDYKVICNAVPEFLQFPLREYSEIRMLVSSRIFGMNIGTTKTDGFVPMADMLNHRRPKQTAWTYSNEHKGFVIESLENIPRGECAFDSYGKKCNSRFLLNYGFIVENNDADEVPIKVELDPEDAQYIMKRALVDSEKPYKSFRVSMDFTEKVMHHFFSFLRFVEYDGNPAQLYIVYIFDQYQSVAQGKSEMNEDDEVKYEGTNMPIQSIANEKKVLRKVGLLSSRQMKEYPTSIEEDEKILKESKDLTFNNRNSVLMRMGEKKVYW